MKWWLDIGLDFLYGRIMFEDMRFRYTAEKHNHHLLVIDDILR